MHLKRRNFLLLLGSGASAIVASSVPGCDGRKPNLSSTGSSPSPSSSKTGLNLSGIDEIGFRPVSGPMPLPHDPRSPSEQIQAYQAYEVLDELVLPEDFEYEVIATWGDRVGNSRFGYNNDYLSFIETGENLGYLTVNFEYISGRTWMETYSEVLGKSLPFAEVTAAIDTSPINAYALPDGDPLKAKIQQICQEALLDQGLGVITLNRDDRGKWVRQPSQADRRVTGISGLTDECSLKATGPATAVFRKTQGQGYIDGLGDRIVGTFANCAGGTTPWGTVLSAEENFQAQVPEPVFPDGTSAQPSQLPFYMDEKNIYGQGNVFGLAGNKYGWIVEIDPANPNDCGTKHTWLGRYRHEAVGVRVEAGKPIAFYSGCDRRGGHIYKFVSRQSASDPQDKANSQLLADGTLYAAKFQPDGTGTWIPLAPTTPIDPDFPSNIWGNSILLPSPPAGGYIKAEQDYGIKGFKERLKTLGDIYTGTEVEKQGAILIDAHYAANAVGATCAARPEDTEIAPDGSLYISFTSGSPGDSGGPDKRIFKTPTGEPHEYGWIMHLVETDNNPGALSFTWQMMAAGGEPAQGGWGFANPDNILLDPRGNLWMVTDMSTSKMNQVVPSRVDRSGQPIDPSKLSGTFGNNSLWYFPLQGESAGDAYLFAIGPMECEMTGPYFSRDGSSLFLAVQHPGESGGIRRDGAIETREFEMLTPTGEGFRQTRQVPIGSNWPDSQANSSPKPSVVAIYRRDLGSIV
ncbi:DUF839 domain-containing protein [Oscillatoriales cyanobacterium LEGE 11467]|uniref:DUF839 domain-containing protein n=1 Tax=Zarconia navalis LEGE 11467 TaxID=1828826 RepID=A0A928VZE5_9CYAN|nr:alkaline phosphatase PhoX [Zarconia navalis]MBE9042078.1 DUF839 domain-containing protein [Zarconia navalis LEGE 11467]